MAHGSHIAKNRCISLYIPASILPGIACGTSFQGENETCSYACLRTSSLMTWGMTNWLTDGRRLCALRLVGVYSLYSTLFSSIWYITFINVAASFFSVGRMPSSNQWKIGSKSADCRWSVAHVSARLTAATYYQSRYQLHATVGSDGHY